MDCKADYEAFLGYMQKLVESQGAHGFLTVKPHQCAIAAWSATRTTHATYTQVDYGHGKTIIIGMLCYYFIKIKGKAEIYIVCPY